MSLFNRRDLDYFCDQLRDCFDLEEIQDTPEMIGLVCEDIGIKNNKPDQIKVLIRFFMKKGFINQYIKSVYEIICQEAPGKLEVINKLKSDYIDKIDNWIIESSLKLGKSALFVGEKPFIGRKDFKENLTRNDLKVYVFRGSSATGKSYSYDLLKQQVQDSPHIVLKMIDLTGDDLDKEDFCPIEIATELGDRLQLSVDRITPSRFTTENRIGKKLAQWFDGQIVQLDPDLEVWLAFDFLENDHVGDELINFCYHLINFIDTGSIKNVRLFLLGVKEDQHLEPNQATTIFYDDLESMSKIDIQTYLNDYCKFKKYDISKDVITTYSDLIFHDLHNPLRHEDMEEFHIRILESVEGIKQVSDGAGHG